MRRPPLTKRQGIARDLLLLLWESRLGPTSERVARRIPSLMGQWSFERIQEAVEIAARRFGGPLSDYHYDVATGRAKYVYGVLRRWRDENADRGTPALKQAEEP